MSEDCIFCEMVKGEAPVSLVHGGTKALAFMDTCPINPGHILVVPTDHVEKLEDLDDETASEVFGLGIKISSALRKSDIRCDGVSMVLPEGEVAGQEVLHVHLHVIPRFEGDNLVISSRKVVTPSREDLERMSTKVENALSGQPDVEQIPHDA
jgi:histidine triad (HIT) family protein